MTRRATLEDIDALTEMFNQYLLFYKKNASLEEQKKYLYERLKNEEAIVFLAIDTHHKPVGFALLYITFSSLLLNKIVILNDLYVDSNLRKNGFAKKLIEETKNYAREIDAPVIRLRTAKNNFTAQALYQKMGFVRDEHLYGYDLVLKK